MNYLSKQCEYPIIKNAMTAYMTWDIGLAFMIDK
jgi:hypothetical protein